MPSVTITRENTDLFPDRYAGRNAIDSETPDPKFEATEAATALLELIWREVGEQYHVGPLTALGIAQKISNAILAGAIEEHADILAEPFKPQQRRLPGVA